VTAAASFLQALNAVPFRRAAIPILAAAEFRDAVAARVESGDRLAALFGEPGPDQERALLAVLTDDSASQLRIVSTDVQKEFPALTPVCPQAHLFEREIWEQCGLEPEGHPWRKPVRFLQQPGRAAQPSVTEFFRMEGEEVHEVAVGPVHAGVIEPGHFRFQCHGEQVHHLEISLGYQHRGVERALVGGPGKRSISYMETLAGDTTIGHATAYAHAVEALSGARPPARAHAIRGIALELERMANHVGDLGALANDVGFLPTASCCGRLRGDVLNMTALICGSRFGRGLVRPGGVGFDVEPDRSEDLASRLGAVMRDVTGAANLLWETPSVLGRFEDTGRLSAETARALGLVGPVARACGLEVDVRHDFPTGIYRFEQLPVSVCDSGDVFARAYVRWLEIQRSASFIETQLRSLPRTPVHAEAPGPMQPEALVISLVEGWRGEICHVAATDVRGNFSLYKVVDPSFHNWFGLAMALRGQQISDFPLCNKSFNLSYCGHDL